MIPDIQKNHLDFLRRQIKIALPLHFNFQLPTLSSGKPPDKNDKMFQILGASATPRGSPALVSGPQFETLSCYMQ